MTNNQLAENSVIQLLNSVKLARDNAERADNRVDHSFYYALTIALEELQERRKAAMDSEPNCKERKLFCSTDTARMRKVISASAGAEATPLYRHAQQPAPVVPDDVLDALQKVARIRLDLNDFDGDRRGIADCLCDAEEALIEVVNRRAAMLAAAPQSPGSEPATVPGKWIPVSERMPEIRKHWLDVTVIIAISGEKYGSEAQYCSDGNFRWGRDEPPIEDVTHWMPLPAAPQEVNRE